jgi:hypothetical protein
MIMNQLGKGPPSSLVLSVRFGAFRHPDQFGFLRDGKVRIDGIEQQLTYSGWRPVSEALNAIIIQLNFFIVVLVCGLNLLELSGIYRQIILVVCGAMAVLAISFLKRRASMLIPIADIREVQLDRRRIVMFRAPDPKSGKLRRGVIACSTEADALTLEQSLKKNDFLTDGSTIEQEPS